MLWDDFFNSKVNAFQDVLNSKIYIDKTGLLEYTNSVIDTTSKFICNSRPRRFGKSITADMMTAYYSRSLDTEENAGSRVVPRIFYSVPLVGRSFLFANSAIIT